MIETHIGAIQTWECDVMGHFNVRFYVSRASEGLAILSHELGIDGGLQLQPLEHHIRFLRELRPGTPIRVFAGVTAVRNTGFQIYLEIRNAATDVPAATFIADTVLVGAAGNRAAVPEAMAEMAGALAVEIPGHGAPRSLTLTQPGPAPTLQQAEERNLLRCYQGVVEPEQCDPAGRMLVPFFMARVADAMPNLVARTRGTDRGVDDKIGGAALEYRLIYRHWPQAGDLLTLRSAIKGIGGKTFTWGHWLFDMKTGAAVMTAEMVGVAFDLVERKALDLTDDYRKSLQAIMVEDLVV